MSYLIMISGGGIFAFQIYLYLKMGEWVSFSIIDFLIYLESEWALSPKDWVGIYQLLDKVSFAFLVFLIGSICYQIEEA